MGQLLLRVGPHQRAAEEGDERADEVILFPLQESDGQRKVVRYHLCNFQHQVSPLLRGVVDQAVRQQAEPGRC